MALFNTQNLPQSGEKTASVQVAFKDLSLGSRCAVRDLWTHKDLGEFSDTFASPIPCHGAGLFRISSK